MRRPERRPARARPAARRAAAALALVLALASARSAQADEAATALAPEAAAPPAERPLLRAPAPRAPDPVAVEAVQTSLAADSGARARILSALIVTAAHPLWGGLSAVEIAPDGETALFLSDRAALFEARLMRRDGILTGLADLRAIPLRDSADRTLRASEHDSEGLARAPDGGLFVAFETPDRVSRYARPGGPAATLPLDPAFRRHAVNEGLEAVAASPEGGVLAFMEAPEPDGRFRLYRLAPGASAWTRESLALPGPHRPTGAAFGPDGALYLLRRDFGLFSGFRMRLDRLDPAPVAQAAPGETPREPSGGAPWRVTPILALSSAPRDNFEGVSLWRAPDGGLRALLVADDNFNAVQRTLLVEIEIDPPG